ncbi:hypothetical protein RBSH_00961 [Rhodopirellula baltica SH28]|uniref:Uncharacterized protein n=1 Tax=Rhodopirellula baltica SH28 TaxID=993517 RepID=K5D9U2_RHOBT|nr:hypothetical protein RBSH_00961 [Rhodopirellula baltica SH28]
MELRCDRFAFGQPNETDHGLHNPEDRKSTPESKPNRCFELPAAAVSTRWFPSMNAATRSLLRSGIAEPERL